MSNKMKWTTLAAIGAALAGITPASASSGRAAQACTPSTNVEAIIDDSGSMLDTDPNELRRGGMELFVTLPGNRGRTLGAVEFGSLADTVFPPSPITADRRAKVDPLAVKIAGDGAFGPTASGVDNGFGTDYNDAFARAAADNPNATARIFLTDGGHNENEFANPHRGGPRTFVVGHEIGPAEPANPNATRLQQIADETGGRYFPNVEQVTLQGVFNNITAALSCSTLKTFALPVFLSTSQRVTRAFKPTLSAKRVTLVVNWATPGNRFGFSRVKALGKRGKVLATLSGKGKPKKLRIKREQADTFEIVTIRRVKGLRRYRFTIAASSLSTTEAPLVQASNLK